jgi:predicted outer membrane lipoprotein
MMQGKPKKRSDEAKMYYEFFTGTFGWILVMVLCAFAVIRSFNL